MANMTKTGADHSVPEIILRDLNSSDVFQMVRILKRIGMSELMEVFENDLSTVMEYEPPMMMEDGKKVPLPREQWTAAQEDAETKYQIAEQRFSAKVLGFLVDHIADCETEIYKILASGAGLTMDEIVALDAVEFINLCEKFVDRENFRNFFTQALRVLQKTGMR